MNDNSLPLPNRVLAIDEMLSLKEARQRIEDMIALHGAETHVRFRLHHYPQVRVSRRAVEHALCHPEKNMAICCNLECPHVGEVFQDDGLHFNAHKACLKRSLALPVSINPQDGSDWSSAILEEMNLGAPDDPYEPEAIWLYD